MWALQDISLEVEPGEVVGIIGRNGAGKSTLLKILSRITEPTTGRAILQGQVGSLLEVGTGFHPELSGRENIFLNGSVLGMKRREIHARFDEIVAFADVEAFIDEPIKHYSTGMQVRLAFAVAAHLQPDILLIDEVLAVGDLAFQKKCLGKMGDIAQEGRTIIFVSHNLGAVRSLCQRGLLIDDGRLAMDDAVGATVESYLQSLELRSSENLDSRTDRSGAGHVRLARVEVQQPGIANGSVLMTGAPARFVFHLTGKLTGLSCSFTIYDQRGAPVCYFDSAMQGHEDSMDSSGRTCFVCETDELLLLSGRYRINAAIMVGYELQDHVEAAVFFDVEPGMLGGRQFRWQHGYSNVALPHRWISPGG
jgi:lipopolysaccharide transport system ATP-binding protein